MELLKGMPGTYYFQYNNLINHVGQQNVFPLHPRPSCYMIYLVAPTLDGLVINILLREGQMYF